MKQKTNKKPPIYKLWISILIVISKIDTGVEPGGTFNQDQSRVDHARCNTAADWDRPEAMKHVVCFNDTAVPK